MPSPLKFHLLASFLFAGAAFGSVIPVTGLGSFGLENFFADSNAQVCFSGSNGSDSVSFCSDVPIGAAPPSFLFANTLHNRALAPPFSIATVDGIQANNWQLSLGGDAAGYINVLDDSGNVLVSQAISGYFETTSYQEFGGTQFVNGIPSHAWSASGTFIITPVPIPEPQSGSLLCLGALWVVLERFRKRRIQ
jgi:hypothetical protein